MRYAEVFRKVPMLNHMAPIHPAQLSAGSLDSTTESTGLQAQGEAVWSP